MNIARPALHGAEQDRVQQLDGWTLILRRVIDGEHFLPSIIFFDEDRPVFRFQFTESLTRPFTSLKRRQDCAPRTDDALQRFADQQFQFIKTQHVLRIGDGNGQNAGPLPHRHEGMPLHELDRNRFIKLLIHAKIRERLVGQSVLLGESLGQLLFGEYALAHQRLTESHGGAAQPAKCLVDRFSRKAVANQNLRQRRTGRTTSHCAPLV